MTESFVVQMEKEMADRRTDLLHLRVIAERISFDEPQKQNEYYLIIEEIVAREKKVQEKLAEFSAAGAGARPVLRKEIEDLWHTTEEAIEVAKAKMMEY